jgi:hypothetical protein
MSGKENHTVAHILPKQQRHFFSMSSLTLSFYHCSSRSGHNLDDGSNRQQPEILSQYNDKKPFDIVLYKENTGFAKALNTAIGKLPQHLTPRADPETCFIHLKLKAA